MDGLSAKLAEKAKIRDLHREQRRPTTHLFLPHKTLCNRCLRFLLGRLYYPDEIGNNGAKFWGVKEVHYGLCENGEFCKVRLVTFQQEWNFSNSLIIHNENTKEFMVNECLEIRYKTFCLRSNMKHFFDTVFHH